MENLKNDNGHRFKVSELFFFSLQGESKFIGVPSIFVRLFGCNFTCSGFGMRRGEKSTERLNIDPKQYSNYNDLPLVSTGCDSYASWDPRFKKFSPMYKLDELVNKITELLPNGYFSNDVHLIMTGGEPLLGWQRGFPSLFETLRVNHNLTNVTFETNGTQDIHPDVVRYIQSTPDIDFFFSISAKLSVSGEKWEEAIKPATVKDYICSDNVSAAFKFVVATEDDIIDVYKAVKEYISGGVDIPVYLMPVGGVDTVYFMNNKSVAELALKNGFRYSPRLQVDLWKNAWAT